MVRNWWHLAQTPDGAHAHQLDQAVLQEAMDELMADDPDLTEAEAEGEVLEDAAVAIRAGLGFPPRARWVNRAGWDSQLSIGEPHPSFLASATVHRADA